MLNKLLKHHSHQPKKSKMIPGRKEYFSRDMLSWRKTHLTNQFLPEYCRSHVMLGRAVSAVGILANTRVQWRCSAGPWTCSSRMRGVRWRLATLHSRCLQTTSPSRKSAGWTNTARLPKTPHCMTCPTLNMSGTSVERRTRFCSILVKNTCAACTRWHTMARTLKFRVASVTHSWRVERASGWRRAWRRAATSRTGKIVNPIAIERSTAALCVAAPNTRAHRPSSVANEQGVTMAEALRDSGSRAERSKGYPTSACFTKWASNPRIDRHLKCLSDDSNVTNWCGNRVAEAGGPSNTAAFHPRWLTNPPMLWTARCLPSFIVTTASQIVQWNVASKCARRRSKTHDGSSQLRRPRIGRSTGWRYVARLEIDKLFGKDVDVIDAKAYSGKKLWNTMNSLVRYKYTHTHTHTHAPKQIDKVMLQNQSGIANCVFAWVRVANVEILHHYCSTNGAYVIGCFLLSKRGVVVNGSWVLMRVLLMGIRLTKQNQDYCTNISINHKLRVLLVLNTWFVNMVALPMSILKGTHWLYSHENNLFRNYAPRIKIKFERRTGGLHFEIYTLKPVVAMRWACFAGFQIVLCDFKLNRHRELRNVGVDCMDCESWLSWFQNACANTRSIIHNQHKPPRRKHDRLAIELCASSVHVQLRELSHSWWNYEKEPRITEPHITDGLGNSFPTDAREVVQQYHLTMC